MQMQINMDPRDQIVALVLSGPNGYYERRIPLESSDPQFVARACAQLPSEDGYDIGSEFGDGSVSFSD
jgi:hypothetical protein